MNPLGQRILAEIQTAQLSASDRRELLAAINGKLPHGHPNPNAKWAGTLDFVVDLCEWASELPADDLPPRMADAARHFGVTSRTISRWLEKATLPGWDGFLRLFVVASRVD